MSIPSSDDSTGLKAPAGGRTGGIRWVDALNGGIGVACGWLLVAMVLIQFFLVLARYVFGYGSTYFQEAVVYLHATIFLSAAGYAFLRDQHVRIDIFYGRYSQRRKSLINILGIIFLLWPFCAFTAFSSWRFVRNSWRILEGSPEGNGLPFLFLLKSMIFLFAFLLALQGLSRLCQEACAFASRPRRAPGATS